MKVLNKKYFKLETIYIFGLFRDLNVRDVNLTVSANCSSLKLTRIFKWHGTGFIKMKKEKILAVFFPEFVDRFLAILKAYLWKEAQLDLFGLFSRKLN